MGFLLLLSLLCIEVPDPSFKRLFPLHNTGQYNGCPGVDVNILPVWEKGYSGTGVVINFAVPGFFPKHKDFEGKYLENLSWNFNSNVSDPTIAIPNSVMFGTAFIGAALAKMNEYGSVGPAHNASFSVVVPNLIFHSLDQFLAEISYSIHESDIFVDGFSSNHFFSRVSSFYYGYRRVSDVERFLAKLQQMRDHKGVITVVPIQAAPSDNSQPRQSLFLQYESVISVSMCDLKGLSGPVGSVSAATVVCAPSYGSETCYQVTPYPPLPGTSSFSIYKEMPTFGFGIHASTVSGIVALLLEINPKLTSRDVKWILIQTARRNDPTNALWVKNAANFYHSPIYGFGLVDANLSMALALNWEGLPPIACTSVSKKMKVSMPFARQGIIDLTLNVESNDVAFIEYMYLRFNATYLDTSLFSVEITSPSGTRAQVVYPESVGNTDLFSFEIYSRDVNQYLIRSFFGEPCKGKWRIKLMDNSFISRNYLNFVELEFGGLRHSPKNIVTNNRTINCRTNSFSKHTDKWTIKLNQTEFITGQNVSVDMTIHEPIDQNSTTTVGIHLLNTSSGQTVHLSELHFPPDLKISDAIIRVPLVLKNTSEFAVLFYHEKSHISSYIPIKIVNTNKTPKILRPLPYETFFAEVAGKSIIDMQWSDSLTEVFSLSRRRMYIVAFYSLSENKRVMSYYSNSLGNSLIAFVDPSKVHHGVAVITKIISKDFDSCSTAILPFSSLFYGDDRESKFPLPLSDACPLPDGVIAESDIIFTSGHSLWYLYVIVALFLVASCSTIFLVYRRTANARIDDLDGQFLL